MVRKRVETRGRTKRPDSRREELVDAALHLLTNVRLEDLRVSDVTEAAGAAKGTFYLYFPSKDHLLAALRQEFSSRFLRRLEKVTAEAAHSAWDQRLKALLEEAVDYSISNQRAHELLFHSERAAAHVTHEDRASELRMVRWLATFIERGVAEGAFDTADAEMSALLLYSAFHGGLDRAVHSGIYDRDRMIDCLESLFRKALAPGPSPRKARQSR